jgi:hypothetical protein
VSDEDITSSNMTILVTFDSKVKQFFIMSIYNTFDELMLHHDVCSISFLEVLTWIKESIECQWKAWRTKYVDWGPSPTPPHILPQGHQVTLSPRKERDKIQHILESLIRIAEQYQTVRAATTLCELRLGAYKYLLERLSRLLYNASSTTSISVWSRLQSSF